MTRRRSIDLARGLAVLLMILAHTFDAWTAWGSRTGRPFAYVAILGGFAAPMFLWLAGIGVGLSSVGHWRRSDRRAAVVEAVVRRGLEIFVLAFLFRLQAFIISPGSYLVAIFRVDILNIMGLAIAAAGLVWVLGSRPATLVAVYAGLAAALAMVTPLVRSWAAVDALPTWVQWYIRPAGDHTNFVAFPWAGFVFAGAACGILLAQARDDREEHRLQGGLAIAGACVLALGFVTAERPSIYAQSSFWTSSPTYFAIRVGILMLGLSALSLMTRMREARGHWPAIERLGRSSLFVYWIHVELVYGYATWPLRQRLPLWGVAVAFVIFSALMYGAVVARDRLVEGWRARQLESSASTASPVRP